VNILLYILYVFNTPPYLLPNFQKSTLIFDHEVNDFLVVVARQLPPPRTPKGKGKLDYGLERKARGNRVGEGGNGMREGKRTGSVL